MKRLQNIQRLWSTKIRPHSPNRISLSAGTRCRNLTLGDSRRGNQYEAYITRLRKDDQTAIKEYLAQSDDNLAVAKFISSIVFVRDITGYTFIDRHLLLQALYGERGPGNPQQRLAMLGDILLQYILKDDWFQLGLPTSRIGGVASEVATNANLANIAKETGFVKHLSVLDPKIKEYTSEHHLGTIMEALLGAIHEDSGKDIDSVRRAMRKLGLTLPKWYSAQSRLYQSDLETDISDLDSPDLQKARSEVNRPDEYNAKYEPDPRLGSPHLQTAGSESNHAIIRTIKSPKRLNMRKKGRLVALPRRQDTTDYDPFEDKDSDQRRLGYVFRNIEEQFMSGEDFEALDAARERLDDMGTDEQSSMDYDTEHADLKQTHLGDKDADMTGFETSATHQGSVDPVRAEFTSSSWRQLVLESNGPSMESKTEKREQRAKSWATAFNKAIGAFKIESDDSPMARGAIEWPVRHSWFPQRCQITLDVALSKTPETTKEEKSYELEQLLAAPTLDVITLPKIPYTTMELAAYDPDRLRVIVAPPREIEGLMAAW